MTKERDQRHDNEWNRISSRSIHKLHKFHSQIFTSATVISDSVDTVVWKVHIALRNQLLGPKTVDLNFQCRFLSRRQILYRQPDCVIKRPLIFSESTSSGSFKIRFREGDVFNENRRFCFPFLWVVAKWRHFLSQIFVEDPEKLQPLFVLSRHNCQNTLRVRNFSNFQEVEPKEEEESSLVDRNSIKWFCVLW